MDRHYTRAQGIAGLGYYVESALENLFESYDEDIAKYLNSLSQKEYDALVEELIDYLEDNGSFWEYFQMDIVDIISFNLEYED